MFRNVIKDLESILNFTYGGIDLYSSAFLLCYEIEFLS